MDRLQLELKVIEKTGFISYFLIVGDFVRYGRSIGISCIARGSAAGSPSESPSALRSRSGTPGDG